MDWYTGRLFEEETLGRCRGSWQGYMAFHKCMSAVKKFQPWDPADPEPEAANDLHAATAIALGVEDWTQLKLFTSVGTPLDTFHGVDGWFEFRGRVVTFDVTVNSQKEHHRADMVLHPADFDREKVEGTGHRIAFILKGGSTYSPQGVSA